MKVKQKILMYHSVGTLLNREVGAGLYSVSVKSFEEQMDYVSGILSCGDSPCLITFDDGDITNYKHAYPILQLLGLRAYFFILVGKVGEKGYMNWSQITELRNAGMIIGSHGMTHGILTDLNDKELDYEIRESKMILEEKLRQPIEYFSIPRGFYNRRVIERIKKAGYTGVFTSNPKDHDGFKFGRIAVMADWDLTYFARVLKKGLPLKHAAKELVKNTSKKLLGTKNYDRVRSRILNS